MLKKKVRTGNTVLLNTLAYKVKSWECFSLDKVRVQITTGGWESPIERIPQGLEAKEELPKETEKDHSVCDRNNILC